jgi:allantoinase
MPEFDLLIKGAESHPFVGIADGKIAALRNGSAADSIDASGLRILPGAIDSHVHFNEPGRAEWEGIGTGSAACAAGGTTTYFDMPLNSTPPVVTAQALAEKRAIGERRSFVDFALWGGLIPGNIDALEGLRDAGAIALKAFMAQSGIDDFPKSDPVTLKAGMKRAAELGLIVGVHAEIDHPELQRGTTVRDYLASRPISMELEAIALAIELAGETRCALHVVHVSSAAGVALIAEARARGADVTCETGPHYLVLNEDDMARIGALAKCAPPLRPEPERQRLLEQTRAGNVQMLGSDHSPAPMSMKTDPDFFRVWGGISGCQHLLRLALDMELPPEVFTRLTVMNAAERFGIAAHKRGIEVGGDADLVLVESPVDATITNEELLYRHKHTPYAGRKVRSRVRQTFLRGKAVFKDGVILGNPRGQFIRP